MQRDTSSYYLLANHLPDVLPRQIEKWRQHFDCLEAIFDASSSQLAAAGLTVKQIEAVKLADWALVEQDIRWAEQPGHHLLTLADDSYPGLLKSVASPPMVLYAAGDLALLDMPQLAMVGARHATAAGVEVAEQFSTYLANEGFCITSGLALGIDAASHRGAMKATGKTIAVMGTGMNHVYPASHRRLAEDLLTQGGLILTEFPLYATPRPYHFPRRNRIIAGLSQGVLVVEAALKSGSLITAKYALEEGREVFAIPGSIHSPLAKGCHALIRQGAKLVETAQDITSEFAFIAKTPSQQEMFKDVDKSAMSAKDSQVYGQIDYAPTPMDVVVWRCGLTVAEVSSILLSLELGGYIETVAGGFVKK